jgi:hypothetical protein
MYNQTMFIIFLLGTMTVSFFAPFLMVWLEDTPPRR